jgi:hypothetical protein
MNDRPDLPRQPTAHHAYGLVIYWVAIAATAICIIGPFLALAFPANNVLNPHYLFYAIWQGRKPLEVWRETGGGFPGAHFWLRSLLEADGFTQLGIVLGCASAGLALVAAGLAYLKRGRREPGWAILCFVNAAIVLFALLGIIQIGE